MHVTGSLLVLVFAFLLPICSLAGDRPPQVYPKDVKEKHVLSKGIQIQITKRGGRLFDQKLSSLFYNLGISFDEAYLEPIKWESDVSYNFDQLDVSPEQKEILISLRNILRNWFHFPFQDVKPAVQIGSSGYQAVFNRFAIVGDEALLNKLGKKEGAVLVLELEIKEMNVAADSIKLYDLNNPFLGEVGLVNAQLKIAGGKSPLKIRVPFYTRINNQGIPEFQAVGIEQNVDQIDLELTYRKILTPKIQLTINGITKDMDTAELEKQLAELIPQGLVEVRKYISDFASKQLPELLNTKAREQLVKAVEEIKPLDPPGVDSNTTIPFQWGLQMKGLHQNQGLYLTLDTFIEDPQNPYSKLIPGSTATGAPLMNTIPKDQFDMALGVDRGMINRMLQLSFERRYFDQIPLDGEGNKNSKCATKQSSTTGKSLKLLSQPLVLPPDWNKVPQPQWGETFAKIHLHVQVPEGTITGSDSWALKDQFKIQFDVIVKLKNMNNKIVIQLWSADLDSIQLDESALTFWGKTFFKETVMNGLRTEFSSMSEQWKCEGTLIPGNIPVPEIFGIKVNVKHLVMEPQGQLILYLEYKE